MSAYQSCSPQGTVLPKGDRPDVSPQSWTHGLKFSTGPTWGQAEALVLFPQPSPNVGFALGNGEERLLAKDTVAFFAGWDSSETVRFSQPIGEQDGAPILRGDMVNGISAFAAIGAESVVLHDLGWRLSHAAQLQVREQ